MVDFRAHSSDNWQNNNITLAVVALQAKQINTQCLSIYAMGYLKQDHMQYGKAYSKRTYRDRMQSDPERWTSGRCR